MTWPIQLVVDHLTIPMIAKVWPFVAFLLHNNYATVHRKYSCLVVDWYASKMYINFSDKVMNPYLFDIALRIRSIIHPVDKALHSRHLFFCVITRKRLNYDLSSVLQIRLWLVLWQARYFQDQLIWILL